MLPWWAGHRTGGCQLSRLECARQAGRDHKHSAWRDRASGDAGDVASLCVRGSDHRAHRVPDRGRGVGVPATRAQQTRFERHQRALVRCVGRHDMARVRDAGGRAFGCRATRSPKLAEVALTVASTWCCARTGRNFSSSASRAPVPRLLAHYAEFCAGKGAALACARAEGFPQNAQGAIPLVYQMTPKPKAANTKKTTNTVRKAPFPLARTLTDRKSVV